MSRGAGAASEAGLRRYIAGVGVLSLAVTAWAWWSLPALGLPTGASPYLYGLGFVAATAAAELLPTRTREGMVVTMSSVVLLTALFVGGTVLAICAVAGVVAAYGENTDRRLQRTVFNYGQMVLALALGGGVFAVLGGEPGAYASPATWAAFLVASLVYTVANFTLVAVAIRFAAGERIASTLNSVLRSSLLLQVLYAGFAVLAAALLLGVGWFALVLLVVPFIVARQGLLAFQREAEAYEDLVGALLKAIEVKDGYTAGHTERVSTLCVEVARELGFSYGEVQAVRYAAKLHDVGKLAVPISVINKPGKLDEDEFALIHEHPVVGADILAEIEFLRPALDGVRYHHERVDGAGYPFGVKGSSLPVMARIITVCDAFDAMTTTRSYRPAMEVGDALTELRRCAGTQFDPAVVETLAGVVDRLAWRPTHEAYDAAAHATTVASGRAR